MSKKFTHRKPYKLRGTRLLAAIVAFILDEPKRFDMQVFTKIVNPVYDDSPACGTVACLAGWADVLTTAFVDTDNNIGKMCGVESRAMRVLGLNRTEANKLFYVDSWPTEFRRAYYRADDLETYEQIHTERAKVAAARVQEFIKQKRAEQKRKRDARYRANRKARLAQAA